MELSKTHCALANTGLFVDTKGTVAQCCIQDKSYFTKLNWSDINDLNVFYQTSTNLNNIRQSLSSGQQHPACKTCWNYENIGNITSKRQKHFYYETTKNTVQHLDLRLTNKCNLQCKMCHPGNSDQWHNLGQELKDKGINTIAEQSSNIKDYDLKHVLELVLNSHDISVIRFAGGEPFVMPEVEEFIFNLIENERTNISLHFITNATVIKPKILEAIQKFKFVQLSCSIDGVEEELEYQRYPVKWNTVENNFKKLYSFNSSEFMVTLVPCIGLLNTLTVDKFMEWTTQFKNINVVYNEIRDPSFQNFRYIPLDIRQPTFDGLQKVKDKFLKNLNPSNISEINNWTNFINKEIYAYTSMPEECKKKLKHYALDIWDYKCNTKFLDAYPWAEQLWT